MAIQFARIEIVSRSSGGSACCKGAYNARINVKDELRGKVYSFQQKGDNVYREVLLPDFVNQKFKNVAILMNAVEQAERRKDSQLLKDIVLALPDDKELDLKDRIEITHRLIAKRGWVREGLGVQIDIHEPHDGEKNWHAHLLVTTRRFNAEGEGFALTKATDLNPEFGKISGKAYVIPEVQQIHEELKSIINDYFAELGLENRVDDISTVAQEHIGPVRMRSILNEAVERNEIRRLAHLENIKDADGVLDRITRTRSVFTKKDIERAVKEIESPELRKRLVEKVMESVRLVALYEFEGSNFKVATGNAAKSIYYTTKEVREEEERVVRIAIKINEQLSFEHFARLKEDIAHISADNINEAQRGALSEILLKPQGIRVLRGRAGTGKSYVLGLAEGLATRNGENVIGLAPTHKAVGELKNQGFKEVHTIKGFLFKLNNNKTTLPNNSMLIIDEAGMVGTSDYQELFKVARVKNCCIILAGDERQLVSVQRGGMFEVMGNHFGCYELSDIRRQSAKWGREMASCFASGDIMRGLELLKSNQAIKQAEGLEQSMADLIEAYVSSEYAIDKKLAITVRNVEVDALNIGIREALKAKGVIKGKEYNVGGAIGYCKGDRILFKITDKRLGIENGEFATLIAVTKDQFIAKKDTGIEVSFNPGEMEFSYGYASTVYKAQGASIKDVYVLHNRVGNSRSSYVAMTRHVEQVKLFYNTEATTSMEHLNSQLSRVDEKSSSLKLLSRADIEEIKNKENTSLFGKFGGWVKDAATSIADRMHVADDYYNFAVKVKSMVKVEEVIEQVALDLVKIEVGEEELAEAANYSGISFKKSYAKSMTQSQTIRDNKAVNAKTNVGSNVLKASFNDRYLDRLDREREFAALKTEIKCNTARVVYSLLGESNKHLSNGRTLRYGKNGSFAVTITGNKSGIWYDFEAGEGGNLFSLIQRENNCDFKGAVSYLQQSLGINLNNHLKLVQDNELKNKYVDHHQQANQEKALEYTKLKAKENISRTDISEFIDRHKQIMNKLNIINPEYNIAELKSKLAGLNNFVGLELLKHTVQSEYNLANSRTNQQIEWELVKPEVNKLSSKQINMSLLRTLAQDYAFERWQAQNYLPLNDNQIKSLISRSIFELNNKELITKGLNGMWFLANPGVMKPLSYIMKCECVADKVTKISGHLVEKMVVGKPEKYLQIKEDNEIIKEAIRINKTRKVKLTETLEHDKQISALSHLGSKVQLSVFEQLVDYRLQHGDNVNVTPEKFLLMQKCALIEQGLSSVIDAKLEAELNGSFIEGRISGDQLQANISESHDFVMHKLRCEIHQQELHNFHLESLNNNITQQLEVTNNQCHTVITQKAIAKVREIQEQVNTRQQLQEDEHQDQAKKMQRGIGIDFNM